MFEGEDDDFSFIDEDFLNDTLEPIESRQLVSKAHYLNNKQHTTNAEKHIDEKLPKGNVKDLPFDGTHINKCGLLADTVKYRVNIQSRARQNENITEKSKSVKNGEFDDFFDNFESDDFFDNFESDDFFDNFESDDFFDNFESDDYNELDTQCTPQDTEFAGVTLDNQPSKAQCKYIGNALPSDDAKCERKADFQSRILKTLKDSISSCITKNDEKHSEAVKLFSVAESERKRRADVPEEVVKKKIQMYSFEEDDSEPDFQSSSFLSTPLIPSPTIVRKSINLGGPVILKRKFPGPAGILPQLSSKTSLTSVQQLYENEQKTSDSKEIVCSQSSADDFSSGPWQQMVIDLEDDPLLHTSPLNVINIKWVLRRADLRGQAGVRKIPFLAVMVRSIDTSCLDATVVLKDNTGEMSGTISSTVLEKYSHCLHFGCVLLLKDVSLLSPLSLKALVGSREPTRRHYLNVTLNTILTIYSYDESGQVITTVVCEVNKKEMFDSAAAMKKAMAPRAIVVEEEEEEMVHKENQQPLFSNVAQSYSISNLHHNKNTLNSNYRIPGSTGCSFLEPGTSTQKQTFRFSPPLNNISKLGEPSTSFDPRIGTPNVNGTPRPHKPSSPYQQPPVTKSQGSFRPVLQPSSRDLSTLAGNVISKSQPIQTNGIVFSSQQEEKEISDLLEGIDADSLFGDF